MTEEEHVIIDKKPEVENAVRLFLKKNEISHLDAIIGLIQSQNILMGFIEKHIEKEKVMDFMNNLHEDDKELVGMTCHISLSVSSFISKINEQN